MTIDNGKIIIQSRDKENYIAVDEEVKVIHNEAILTEIPNKFMKVKIDGMNELNSDIFTNETLKENQYKVDYDLGRVYFNSSLDNRTLRFKYQGTGIVLYPASRIYTKNKDGIIQSLQIVVDKTSQAVEIIEKLDEIVKYSDEIYLQLNTAITETTEKNNILLSSIASGKELITNLDKFISNANTTKINLQDMINSGNTTIAEFNNTKIAILKALGDKKVEYLDEINNLISEKKEELNVFIKDSNNSKNDLNEFIKSANTKKDEILKIANDKKLEVEDTIESVNAINTEIKKNIQKSETKNTELTTSIKSAVKVNNDLNGSVTSGINKIEEINNKISDVSIKLNQMNSEEIIRKDNENIRSTNEVNRQNKFNQMETTIANHSALFKEYSSTQKYVIGNQVVYNGSTYECIKESLNILPTNETNWICIARKGADGLGSGDMHTSIYDSNNNGVVDNAEKVNGFTVECNVPADAKFTDTIYDDTNIKNELGELNKKLINNETLDKKADLVNGKVPLEQLPNNIGNSFVELENVMVLTKDENIISINISQYNVSKDKIVVLLNGRELTIDKDFKVSNDNIHIENISDKILWKANDEIKIKILKNIPTELHELDVSLIPNNSINEDKLNKEFVKSINDKIKELTSLKADLVSGKIPLEQLPDNIGNSYIPFYNTIALEEDTTNIPIGISQFNADTDDLEVVDFNGNYLNKNEWKINDNKTSIDNINDKILWQKGDTITFKVVKNIPSEIPSIDVALIPNGSIVKEKLNANFINEVNGKVDKVEGKGLSSNDFANEDKNKLNGIEVNANNYIHPSKHNISMIEGISEVGKTGSYNDLINKPTIPINTSELNNDSGFITDTELNNKLTLFNATCIYTTNYNVTIENNPTLPNYFTLRFKAPNNYIEGKTFNIGSDVYTPKNANFETNDILSVEFDKVNKKCFFKVGGGSGINETLPPQIENFNILSGNAKLNLTWTISDVTYLNGYVFTVKENSVPNNVNDGVKYEIDKSKTSYEISGLTNNTKYYVRPFPYNSKKQYQSEYIIENGTPTNGMPINSLPIGSKIKFGKYQVESENAQPITWKVIDNNNHYRDENNNSIVNHVTLTTEKIIDFRAFDAKEPNNSDEGKQYYGNNNYRLSNIRQWLNSNKINWFSKTHSADEPPTDRGIDSGTGYDTKAGFLNLFTQEEIDKTIPTNLKVEKVIDDGGSEIVNDKVFLLSRTEVGLDNENDIVEGKSFSIFSDNASRSVNLTEQCLNYFRASSNENWYWLLRTPYNPYPECIRAVSYCGSLDIEDYKACYGNIGVRPALNLNAEVQVSLAPDVDGCYVVI